jgi:ribosomal protein L11 methyltransferase
MRWIELSASVNSREVDKVASVLGQFGQGGATIEEWQSEINGEKTFNVKIYLPHGHSYKQVRSNLEQELATLQFSTPVQLKERLLKPDDWFDSLKKHFGILEIGERFIIKPSWICEPLPVSTRIIIELDPGAAFGTGLHPTTRLCLTNLEKYLVPGMSVLDLGTGSGILSIAAAKLGASSVLALDIDPVAVKAARSNIRINGVDDHIQVKRGTLSIRTQREFKGTFDMALANITAQAISGFSQSFTKILRPGGKLIVSGINSQGLDEVLISLVLANFKLEKAEQEGDWNVVVAINR